MAHILQGAEARMLDVTMNQPHKGGLVCDYVTLIQHDGFTSTESSIDVEQITQAIFDETGIQVSMSIDYSVAPFQRQNRRAKDDGSEPVMAGLLGSVMR